MQTDMSDWVNPIDEEITITRAIKTNNHWYRNCKNNRKENRKCCVCCPFRHMIRNIEEE